MIIYLSWLLAGLSGEVKLENISAMDHSTLKFTMIILILNTFENHIANVLTIPNHLTLDVEPKPHHFHIGRLVACHGRHFAVPPQLVTDQPRQRHQALPFGRRCQRRGGHGSYGGHGAWWGRHRATGRARPGPGLAEWGVLKINVSVWVDNCYNWQVCMICWVASQATTGSVQIEVL